MGMTVRPPGNGVGATVQPPQTGGQATVGQPGSTGTAATTVGGTSQLTVRNTQADGPTVTWPKAVVADPQLTPGGRGTATVEGGAAAPGGNTIPGQVEWGQIGGDIAAQSDLQLLFATKLDESVWNTQVPPAQQPINTAQAANNDDQQAEIDDLEQAVIVLTQLVNDGVASIAGKVNRVGDDMTGNLSIANTPVPGSPSLTLRKTTGAWSNLLVGQVGTSNRWTTALGDSTTESGSDAGSNYAITRWNDAGVSLGTAFSINRATGAVAMPGAVTTGQAAVDNRVDINALTGQDANLLLHKPASGRRNQVVGYTGATAQRWAVIPGDEVAESGSDAGSNFKVERYTDAAVTYNALQILRKNGYVVVGRGPVRAAALTDAEGGVSNIEMNAVASGTGNYITTNVAGNLRWQLKLGNGSAETGSNAGSNFAISRYADNGVLLGDVMSILRSNGDVGFSTGSVTLGSLGASVGLSLSKTAGANIASITSFTGGSARWQMQLSNGAVESGGNAGSDFALYRYNDAGAVIDTALSISRSNGYIYSGAGSGFFAGPTIGFRTNSYQSASGNYYAMMTAANPNWNDVYFQAFHAPGIEAGLYLALVTTGTWKWANNGNAYAPGAWVDSSDMRVKTDRARIADARAVIAGLTGYTYRRTDLSNMDGSPVLDAGLLGQDIDAVLPVAVSKSERKLPDGTVIPDFHNVNYNGVTAALVEDNNGLAARIEQLEAALTAALVNDVNGLADRIEALEAALAAALARIQQLEAP